MTQLELARNNQTSDQVKKIAAAEGLQAGVILKRIRLGKVVVLKNRLHSLKKPCGIGLGLTTKVNANIGTSTDKSEVKAELIKLNAAIKYGADTVMDLSVGGDLRKIREEIIGESPVPVGTVPIYEIAVRAQKDKGDFVKFDSDDMFDVLKEQAAQGVDFFTIHAGVTANSVAALRKSPRVLDIVSRGGAILANWMACNKRENPFYEYFDRVLDITHEYDVTLSLGDGLRPGSIHDATDKAQLAELKILGSLAVRARRRGVQVMIEGPGHVPINQVQKNIELEKDICNGAPFYVLGPLVTDVAAGYDHITASIGGALAASVGADFLCYVTASEHLRHPDADDVREGVVAAKIAAHAGDIAKGIKSALSWDMAMSKARKKRDWTEQIKLSIDPERAQSYRSSSRPHLSDVCTMCGEYCSIKLMEGCRKTRI